MQRPPRTGSVEHRAFERARVKAGVVCTRETRSFTATVRNISVGGLYIATPEVLPVGTRLDLTFTLPGADPIAAPAEVCWTTPDARGMGVRFVELGEKAQQVISAFVAMRDPVVYLDA